MGAEEPFEMQRARQRCGTGAYKEDVEGLMHRPSLKAKWQEIKIKWEKSLDRSAPV
jgi:hypothetical protein